MKYTAYGDPNYVLKEEYDKLIDIPVYKGCNAGESGCACLGTCYKAFDYLTKDEVDKHGIRIITGIIWETPQT